MRALPLLVVLSACWAGTETSSFAEQALSTDSPFLPMPGEGGQAKAASDNAALELKGVMVDRDTVLFNIFNQSTKKSQWVALRATGSDIVVKSHELVDDTDTVTVEHQGRTLRLVLAKPKTTSSGKAQTPQSAPTPHPVPLPAIAGAQQKPPEGLPIPVVINPTPADEARRLEAVAAEVRRRRALRQDATGEAPRQNAP